MFKLRLEDVDIFELKSDYVMIDGYYVIVDKLYPQILNNTEALVHVQGKPSLEDIKELVNSKIIEMVRWY